MARIRLNDTAAIANAPLRHNDGQPGYMPQWGDKSCKVDPDAGRACSERRPLAGKQIEVYDPGMGEYGGIKKITPVPQPNAGSESLKGTAMYLGKKLK